ncbi:MAG: ATP-binding protein [Rudaea sp.]
MHDLRAAEPDRRPLPDLTLVRRVIRPLVPAAASLFALFLTATVPTVEKHSPFLLFVAAVLLSAWYGGTAAGVEATVLSIILRVLFVYAAPSPSVRDPSYVLPVLVFALVSLFVTSLTARLRREVRLARQQAALIDLSADAIISRLLDGTITFWSRGAETLYGWPKEEARGRTTKELFHTHYPEPFEQIVARLQHEGSWQGDMVHTRKDGTPVTVSSRWQLHRGEHGNPDTILETNTDITDRKRAEEALRASEERFRSLFDSMSEGFEVDELIRDAGGRPVDYVTLQVNPAHERESGLTREQLIGRRVTTVLPSVDPFWLEQFGRVVASGEPVRFEAYSKSLGRWLEVYAYSLHEGDRFAVLSRDISERKRAEQERAELLQREQDARAVAEAAVEIRDHFISIASHELKTPLTSIKGYADLLVLRGKEGQLDEQFQRMARTIEAQAGRLEKMIGALLDISRIERGQLSLERQPIDLARLIEYIVDDIRPTLRRHPLALQSDGPGLVVEGDETRLEQVFQNLIQNAIKYSPTGGPVIVRLYREDGNAKVDVSDKGIGIPEDELPKLFTRFHRARNAEAFHISGLGVGLYVVREVVRLHGGNIAVESHEGRGTTFTVALPLKA